MKFKYVRLRELRPLALETVVFGFAPLTHKEIAAAFAKTHEPRSAGFCQSLPGGKWRVFGQSISLGLAPAPGDELFIGAIDRATEAMVVDETPAA